MTKRAAAQAQYIRSLKEAEGGVFTSAEYEQSADITRQALKRRRDRFAIVYWTDAKGHCWYPKWQFDGNNQVLPEVRAILELLHSHDTLHVLTTFLVPAVGDSGESPLRLIQAGRGEEALTFVRACQSSVMPKPKKKTAMGRLARRAVRVFESKKGAAEWMRSPAFGLGGRIPREVAKTKKEAREIARSLTRIDYGVP